MRGFRLFACVVALVSALGSSAFAAREIFYNNTWASVYGIRIDFSSPVLITGYDKVVFPTQEPLGATQHVSFRGGVLPLRGSFTISWSGEEATVTRWQWLETPDASEGFSLTYDVDLTKPNTHVVSVVLTIQTKGITSLSLCSVSPYNVSTASRPDQIDFSAAPAFGLLVRETTRQSTDYLQVTIDEPIWQLSFAEGATVTVRYKRRLTHESESSDNGVRAYLGGDLFAATGDRYLILPDMGDAAAVWTEAYASELQSIVVRYRLPDGWAIWAPWDRVDNNSFDPCTYTGINSASTNLVSLSMSTVLAGPQDRYTALSRIIGDVEVTLVFSRAMKNLNHTAEQMFEAFALTQTLWGESLETSYLGVFPTTSDHLWIGEWANSQGFSANHRDAGGDIHLFLHQIYHRWNSWVSGACFSPAAGRDRGFYTEGWNNYYTDKICNQLRVFGESWRYCRGWYAEYLTWNSDEDAPVARPYADTVEQLNLIIYWKGALVAYLLDQEIQHRTQGKWSLDDVVKALWAEYGHWKERGNTWGALDYDRIKAVILRVTGEDLTAFFDAYVTGKQRLVIPELR